MIIACLIILVQFVKVMFYGVQSGLAELAPLCSLREQEERSGDLCLVPSTEHTDTASGKSAPQPMPVTGRTRS